jgi:hypothetical protein
VEAELVGLLGSRMVEVEEYTVESGTVAAVSAKAPG